ncbi:HipA N-terminal domain-containing protein [Erwinia rhapontici]|uniref:HipA N-terminal domain-containing protein n=1 Tax=Erwinia rhapontici TaxID=55212 RepID=UPI003BA0CA10
MRRRLTVWLYGEQVGWLTQNDEGYLFEYRPDYAGPPLSLSLPVDKKRFPRNTLHPFFASLAPEGWLKRRYSQLQKIDEQDQLGMLLHNGENLIGAVRLSVEEPR